MGGWGQHRGLGYPQGIGLPAGGWVDRRCSGTTREVGLPAGGCGAWGVVLPAEVGLPVGARGLHGGLGCPWGLCSSRVLGAGVGG